MFAEKNNIVETIRSPVKLPSAEGEIFERNPSILSMLTKAELAEYVGNLFDRDRSLFKLGIEKEKFRRFIKIIGAHYHENPYHNFHHAVDTVNTMGWLISRPVLKKNIPLHYRFLLLLAALIHDVDHPGTNNQWEVAVGSPKADKYREVAVLEKHSYDVTMEILSDPAYDLFSPLGKEAARKAVKILEELILATDFAMHRHFMDGFREFLDTHPIDFSRPLFLSWVSRALIKAADIANTSKPYSEAKIWGHRVMLEFWSQGVLEKKNNFPLGPYNDPESVELNAAQAGFIKYAAMELFELLCRVDPGIKLLVDTLNANMAVYEEKARNGDPLFE